MGQSASVWQIVPLPAATAQRVSHKVLLNADKFCSVRMQHCVPAGQSCGVAHSMRRCIAFMHSSAVVQRALVSSAQHT